MIGNSHFTAQPLIPNLMLLSDLTQHQTQKSLMMIQMLLRLNNLKSALINLISNQMLNSLVKHLRRLKKLQPNPRKINKLKKLPKNFLPALLLNEHILKQSRYVINSYKLLVLVKVCIIKEILCCENSLNFCIFNCVVHYLG